MTVGRGRRVVVARARDLSTRAGRLAAGRCLLEGASLIGQALDAGVTLRTFVT